MKRSSPSRWVNDVKPCTALRVIKQTRLWPAEMWYGSSDEDTLVMVTPILTPGEICSVIDVLKDDDGDDCYAALVVCSEGVGCILIDVECFGLL